MRYAAIALLSVLSCCAVVAAPVPAAKPFTSDWDKPVDPYRDCKFIPEKDALTIEVPGGDHDLDFKRDRRTAPRVLHDVEGDFEVQVRVQGELNPTRKSSSTGVPSSVTAGLLLLFPDGNCVRLDFGADRGIRGHRECVYVRHLFTKGGGMYASWHNTWDKWPLPKPADRAYLKLVRRGGSLWAFLGADGINYTQLVPFGATRLPKRVKVGLAAYSTSTDPFKVRFDQFKLTPLGLRDN
jgi:hypothetical protein